MITFPRKYNVCVEEVLEDKVILQSNCKMGYLFWIPIIFIPVEFQLFWGKPLSIEITDFFEKGLRKFIVKERVIKKVKDNDDDELQRMIDAL